MKYYRFTCLSGRVSQCSTDEAFLFNFYNLFLNTELGCIETIFGEYITCVSIHFDAVPEEYI
ncbi:MAG: hypothetical protein K0S33_3923 [Bacteroidetes bacterium]|jgi:hypothetical protein|nr:hypothetical protein [Bacteroidota bacterium]